MTPTSGQNHTADDLLNMLVERKIISAGQADVARADMQVSGMPIDEVLIARRWVTEDTLSQVAPWLKEKPAPKEAAAPAAGEGNNSYQENLKKYRDLMHEILGE